MIKLGFSAILGIYTLFWLFIFFILWLSEKLSSLGRFNRMRKFIRQCKVCTHTYFLSSDYSISRCPLCGSLNKKED